jgi:NusA-like KH domain protein
MAIINMQEMRYINLLDRTSHVKTRRCFVHNNTIFFAVSHIDLSKAIGPGAVNVRKIQEQLGKRVRIIAEPKDDSDVKRFIEDIVSPVRIKSIEAKDGVMTLTSGNTQNKAILIGRNKRRYEELKRIVKEFFEFDLKIL